MHLTLHALHLVVISLNYVSVENQPYKRTTNGAMEETHDDTTATHSLHVLLDLVKPSHRRECVAATRNLLAFVQNCEVDCSAK